MIDGRGPLQHAGRAIFGSRNTIFASQGVNPARHVAGVSEAVAHE
jgi:hypothetical protein